MKNRLYILICIFYFLFFISYLPVCAEPVNIPSLVITLQVEGNPSLAWFKKGKLLYKLQAYREAAAALLQVGQVGEDIPRDMAEEALYLRANSLMKTGDYPEAMEAANLIPAGSRFYSYGLYTKGMISLHTGREGEAIGYLEEIAKDFTDTISLKARLTLGFISLERNKPVEAIRHFSIIPRESPLYPQALFGSGWAYAEMGRWVRAVVFWEELSHLYPENKYKWEVMPLIGHAYAALSAYGKALQHNSVALQYYKKLEQKLSDMDRRIRLKDMKGIKEAMDITGDKGSSSELELYNGLLSMEEYLRGENNRIKSDVEALTKASEKKRSEIIGHISERLMRGIDSLRHRILEDSINTSLEIARNLRAEGGGRISNEMIFTGP